MRTSRKSLWISLAAFFLTSAAFVYAYPPDNAAILYYSAMMRYHESDTKMNLISDFARGCREPNDVIRGYFRGDRGSRRIVNTLLDACDIENCDWGVDYSNGFKTELPHLHLMRRFSEILIANARLLAIDGNYSEALDRCMRVYKMARHINDRALICYLLGTKIQSLSNDCVIWILENMPPNKQNLVYLKNELSRLDSIPFQIKLALWGERDAVLTTLSPEKSAKEVCDIIEMFVSGIKDESFKSKIQSFDRTMLDRSQKYFEDYYAGILNAFDMPYSTGYALLSDLAQKVSEDAKHEPEAILTEVFRADYQKSFSVMIRDQTQNNAIRTAVEVYLVKAQTGNLPDALPAGLPLDLFSGKPFVYEKTADGFVLRCQGKDLSKDEIYSYEFKVK